MQCESELKNILIDGIALESNEEKAEAFAKAFSDIRSNKNYNFNFIAHKNDIESNQKHIFENSSNYTDDSKINLMI